MGQINEHRVRIRSRVQISRSKFEKGMIVSAAYTPLNEQGKKGESKNYMLLILNPLYQKKVHALSLDGFGYTRLNELASKVGLAYVKSFQKMRKLNLPKLVMEGSSKQFYYGKLKRDISSKWGNSYRTFHENSFKTLYIVDYKFNKAVEEEFLKQDIKKSESKKLSDSISKDLGLEL